VEYSWHYTIDEEKIAHLSFVSDKKVAATKALCTIAASLMVYAEDAATRPG
jgi:hypothetical protein